MNNLPWFFCPWVCGVIEECITLILLKVLVTEFKFLLSCLRRQFVMILSLIFYNQCWTPWFLFLSYTSTPPPSTFAWHTIFLGSPLHSVQFSCSVMSDSLQLHGLQHARPPCPSPTPGVYTNSCPLSRWCHPTISTSIVPFSSCLQSFPALGSFQRVSSLHQVAIVLEFQVQCAWQSVK